MSDPINNHWYAETPDAQPAPPKRMTRVGVMLVGYRYQANLSQSAAAVRAGIERSLYCRYESGERRPSLLSASRICAALSIPLVDFVGAMLHDMEVERAA